MHLWTCGRMNVCIYVTDVRNCVHTHARVSVCTYVHMHVCMHACMHVRLYACMCGVDVCMACMYVHIPACARARVYTSGEVHMCYECMHTCSNLCSAPPRLLSKRVRVFGYTFIASYKSDGLKYHLCAILDPHFCKTGRTIPSMGKGPSLSSNSTKYSRSEPRSPACTCMPHASLALRAFMALHPSTSSMASSRSRHSIC